MIHYKGEVVQVIEAGSDKYELRVNIAKEQYGWGDTAYIYYSGNRFLERDIIEFPITFPAAI